MFNRYKIFAAYLFAIPLALLLGILAASPDEISFMLIGLLLFFLALPLVLNSHHAMLIIFWNSAFSAFFLPGQPEFWLLLTGISFGISFLGFVMGRRPFISVPEMTRPLLFLAGVVLVTALWRGGIGIKALGGAAHGGRYYISILAAILGYFALTAGRISLAASRRLTGLFFLSGTTYVLSNLAYTLGPAFYFLYYLVPANIASVQAANDFGLANMDRILGLSQACLAVMCFLLAHFSVRSLLDWTKPWRLLLLLAPVCACMFSGYRSAVLLLALVFAIQFCLEGLWRTRLCLGLVGFGAAAAFSLLIFVNKMPLPVQRAVSFLPVNVDSVVRADASRSTQWRMEMWSIVLKDLPRYLVIGKGYGFDPTDMYLTQTAIHMGLLNDYEEPLLAGDYHNGPLSVIVPFGIIGSVAFLWVVIAAGRLLHLNYRNGEERLRRINTTLFAFYLTNVLSFFFIFGALKSDIAVFLGICGLSVCLNGGVRRVAKPFFEGVYVLPQRAYATEVGG